MAHVCPWWRGFFIDNPLRRLFHNSENILGPPAHSVSTGPGSAAVTGESMIFMVAPARMPWRRYTCRS